MIWKRLWSLKIPCKIINFLWKICTNCLPVRTELHKTIFGISPLCHFCDEANETVEHLFLLCLMAKAIWFGMELSIRMDEFCITLLKAWLLEWLSKPELLKPEAVWFYGRIVTTLWSLWIRRNECIFKGTKANPIKVIFNQKIYYHWIIQASQEKDKLLSTSSKNPRGQYQKNFKGWLQNTCSTFCTPRDSATSKSNPNYQTLL